MTVKTILACLLDRDTAPMLSAAAATLARRFDAHLTGVHAPEAIVIYPGIAMIDVGPTYQVFYAEQKKEGEAIGAIFKEETARAGVASEWRMVTAGAFASTDRVIESARAADLVVIARPERGGDRLDRRHAFDRIVRESGRPVLVVPPGGLSEGGIGNRVVLAHAPTREAARAAFDALPLLQEDPQVHVVRAGDDGDELRNAAMTDLAGAMARHGAKVTLTHRPLHDRSIARVLTDEAAEIGADLLVAGAFGHSRTYDFLLGATTGELVRSAEVPILFAT